MENNRQISHHQISRILQVLLPDNLHQGQQRETAFRVLLNCQCCMNTIAIMTRTEVQQYGYAEQALRIIEETEQKERRERETRQNAEELLKYLDFADIEDFTKLPPDAFQEINFFSNEAHSEEDGITEDNESQVEDNGFCTNQLNFDRDHTECILRLNRAMKLSSQSQQSQTSMDQLHQSVKHDIAIQRSQPIIYSETQQLVEPNDPRTEIEEEKDSQSLAFQENSEELQDFNQDITSFLTPCDATIGQIEFKQSVKLIKEQLELSSVKRKRTKKLISKLQDGNTLSKMQSTITEQESQIFSSKREETETKKKAPKQIFKITKRPRPAQSGSKDCITSKVQSKSKKLRLQ